MSAIPTSHSSGRLSDGIPENPFRSLRVNFPVSLNKKGLSQYEVARRVGVTKHSVLRLEQGCFDSPLPSLVDFFLSHTDISKAQLLREYEEFQYKTRLSNAGLLGDSLAVGLLTWRQDHTDIHPLTWLRTTIQPTLNPTELAKRLCISQSTISYFERRVIHQHSVPAQLINALHDAEYTEQDTDALENAYRVHRNNILKESKKNFRVVK